MAYRPAGAPEHREDAEAPGRIAKFVQLTRTAGPVAAGMALVGRLRGPAALPWYAPTVSAVAGRTALEIGGPSAIFGDGGTIPLYRHLGGLDTVDYAARTLWSTARSPGRPPGQWIIGEARTLAGVPEARYDVVLASHVLEHIANPLGALARWREVLRPGGTLLVIVPDSARTFDHRRTPTSLAHLREDQRVDRRENDDTHVPEILSLHDLRRDPGSQSRERFIDRARRNAEFRSLHHHVFTPHTLEEVLSRSAFDSFRVERLAPFHLVAVAQRQA